MSGNAYCACCTGTDLSHSRSAPPPIAVLPDAAFDAQVALAATRSAFVKEKYMASAETGASVFKIVPFGPAMIRCFKERGLVNAEGVPGFELKFDLETDAWVGLVLSLSPTYQKLTIQTRYTSRRESRTGFTSSQRETGSLRPASAFRGASHCGQAINDSSKSSK